MKQVILLHAALGNKAQMKPLAEILSPHFEIHNLNLSGHDFEQSDGRFTISNFETQVAQYIEDKALKKPTIIGYSLGGYVACAVASNHPDLLAKVICYGTRWDWNPEFSLKEAGKLNPEFLEEKAPTLVAKLQERFGHENWKTVLEKTANMMRLLGNGAGMNDYALASIPIPVILLRGTEDRMVTESESIKTALLIPQGKFLSLPGMVHQIELLDVNLLARELIPLIEQKRAN